MSEAAADELGKLAKLEYLDISGFGCEEENCLEKVCTRVLDKCKSLKTLRIMNVYFENFDDLPKNSQVTIYSDQDLH